MNVEVGVPQQTENYISWLPQKDDLRMASLEKKLRFITQVAVNSPSSHNTQPWAFRVDETNSSIVLLADSERRLTESDPDSRELYLSLGCALGTMEVTAHYLGFSIDTEFKTNPNNGLVYADLKFKDGYEPTEEDNNLFEAIFKRVNYDGDHLTKPLIPEAVKVIENVFQGVEGVEFKLVSDTKIKDEIAELVMTGDKLTFGNKRFVGELATWLRDAATSRKDGLLTSVLGLPQEVRRYALKFILNVKEKDINSMAKADRDKIKVSAAIGVIAVEKEDPQTLMQVGRLYQLASLRATNQGVYFAARAVLIETGDLHKDLSKLLSLTGRSEMMFRAGYPKASHLEHTPRYQASEKKVVEAKGELKVVSLEHPTIFSLSKDYNLQKLIDELGEGVQVKSKGYAEHWLPDLFNVENPALALILTKKSTRRKLKRFIDSNNRDFKGVWVYNPIDKTLEHLPNENDFYKIITVSNSRLITKEGQRRLRSLKVGVAGLSGSGAEAAWAIVMSGIKHLNIADFDYVSPKNKNRMQGATGENKAWVLAWELWRHNPFLDLKIYYEGITEANVNDFVKGLDLVVEQTDSSSKFRIRQTANGIVAMVTDFEDPKIDIEKKGDTSFGGRAAKAGITSDSMDKIKSLAESTGYLATLMGPNDIPERNYQNFSDILKGKAGSYSQTFIGSQSGGGAIGRVLIALAEGSLDKLPKSWIVRTLPSSGSNSEKKKLKKKFFKQYEGQFGKI